jgi:hypothetical protein
MADFLSEIYESSGFLLFLGCWNLKFILSSPRENEKTGRNIISADSRNPVLGTDCFLPRLPFFTIWIRLFLLFLPTGNNQLNVPAGFRPPLA